MRLQVSPLSAEDEPRVLRLAALAQDGWGTEPLCHCQPIRARAHETDLSASTGMQILSFAERRFDGSERGDLPGFSGCNPGWLAVANRARGTILSRYGYDHGTERGEEL